MKSESRAWERPDGTLYVPVTTSVVWQDGGPLPSDAVPLHPVPDVTEDDPRTAGYELLRTGRKVGRTIYVQHGLTPSDDDPLIGVMDTAELAARVVEAVNAAASVAGEDAASADEDPRITGTLHRLAWRVHGAAGSGHCWVFGDAPDCHAAVRLEVDVDRSHAADDAGRPDWSRVAHEIAAALNHPAQPAVAPGTEREESMSVTNRQTDIDTRSAAPTRDALMHALRAAEVVHSGHRETTWEQPTTDEAYAMADVALGVLRGGGADGGGEDEDVADPCMEDARGRCGALGHTWHPPKRRVELPWSMTRPADYADDDEELNEPEPRCGAFHPEYGFTCRDLPKGHGRWHWDRAGGYWDHDGQHIDGMAAADILPSISEPSESYLACWRSASGDEVKVSTYSREVTAWPARGHIVADAHWLGRAVLSAKRWADAYLEVGDVVTGDRAVSAPLGTKLGAKKAAVAAVHTVNGWSVTGMNHEQDHERAVRINHWVVLALGEGSGA